MIRAVVFDVGECLVDETREYGTWADLLGVPRHTFAAMFGAVIAQGRDYRDVFQAFAPGFDLYGQRQARADAARPEHFDETDTGTDGHRGSARTARAATAPAPCVPPALVPWPETKRPGMRNASSPG